jgi:hypothetical protein
LQEQYTAVTGKDADLYPVGRTLNNTSAGRQPTPPEFMLGYQQSKLRYYNQTQVLNLAQRFHDEKVKVSLIVVGV